MPLPRCSAAGSAGVEAVRSVGVRPPERKGRRARLQTKAETRAKCRAERGSLPVPGFARVPPKRTGRCRRRQTKEELSGLGRRSRVRPRVPPKAQAVPVTDLNQIDPRMSPREYTRFASLITDRLGIRMTGEKIFMLQGRLTRRLRHLRLASFREYLDYLQNSPGADEEYLHFVSAVTTNKTDFFREPAHFDYLVASVLPELDRRVPYPRPWRLALWCAGCSSGQEAYTQAMILGEYAACRPGFDFAILATDVSESVLRQARDGIYKKENAQPIPAALRARYLRSSRDPARHLVRVVPGLRRKISFHTLNFMDDSYSLRDIFDVIFFRNVMIYFDRSTQEAVIGKLCRHLAPGGWLFVGNSESLAGLRVPVRLVAPAVFRKCG